MDGKIKWQTRGAKTTIVCFQVGENYFSVREMDNDTHETVAVLTQTFSLAEAWGSYIGAVEQRACQNLREQDKARRPAEGAKVLITKAGTGHVTDLQHPFVRQLMEDYRAGKRIPVGDALSEEQRREFDRMVIEFLAPDLPREIVQFHRRQGA